MLEITGPYALLFSALLSSPALLRDALENKEPPVWTDYLPASFSVNLNKSALGLSAFSKLLYRGSKLISSSSKLEGYTPEEEELLENLLVQRVSADSLLQSALDAVALPFEDEETENPSAKRAKKLLYLFNLNACAAESAFTSTDDFTVLPALIKALYLKFLSPDNRKAASEIFGALLTKQVSFIDPADRHRNFLLLTVWGQNADKLYALKDLFVEQYLALSEGDKGIADLVFTSALFFILHKFLSTGTPEFLDEQDLPRECVSFFEQAPLLYAVYGDLKTVVSEENEPLFTETGPYPEGEDSVQIALPRKLVNALKAAILFLVRVIKEEFQFLTDPSLVPKGSLIPPVGVGTLNEVLLKIVEDAAFEFYGEFYQDKNPSDDEAFLTALNGVLNNLKNVLSNFSVGEFEGKDVYAFIRTLLKGLMDRQRYVAQQSQKILSPLQKDFYSVYTALNLFLVSLLTESKFQNTVLQYFLANLNGVLDFYDGALKNLLVLYVRLLYGPNYSFLKVGLIYERGYCGTVGSLLAYADSDGSLSRLMAVAEASKAGQAFRTGDLILTNVSQPDRYVSALCTVKLSEFLQDSTLQPKPLSPLNETDVQNAYTGILSGAFESVSEFSEAQEEVNGVKLSYESGAPVDVPFPYASKEDVLFDLATGDFKISDFSASSLGLASFVNNVVPDPTLSFSSPAEQPVQGAVVDTTSSAFQTVVSVSGEDDAQSVPLVQKAEEKAGGYLSGLSASLDGLLESYNGAISRFLSKIQADLNEYIFGPVQAAFRVLDALVNLLNLPASFVNGIISAVQSILNAVKGLIDKTVNTVKGAVRAFERFVNSLKMLFNTLAKVLHLFSGSGKTDTPATAAVKPSPFPYKPAYTTLSFLGDLPQYTQGGSCPDPVYGPYLPAPVIINNPGKGFDAATFTLDALYTRNFYFLELIPVKLKHKKGDPYFVFSTEYDSDYCRKVYSLLKELASDLGVDTSILSYADCSCSEERGFVFMLDKSEINVENQNDYGESFLQTASSLLSSPVRQFIQMFSSPAQVEELAQKAAEKASRTLADVLGRTLEQQLQQKHPPSWLQERLSEFKRIAANLMTGGRYDGPVVWNSSKSSLGFRGEVHLIAELPWPELVMRKIVEPLTVLWALAVPRGMDLVLKSADDWSKYFFYAPVFVKARLWRGLPEHVTASSKGVRGKPIFELPAAALTNISMSLADSSTRFRGADLVAARASFSLIPVYSTVYFTEGKIPNEAGTLHLKWLIKQIVSMVKPAD